MKIYLDKLPNNCAEYEHCTKAHEGSFEIPFCNVERMPIYGGDYDKDRGRQTHIFSNGKQEITISIKGYEGKDE